MNLAPFELSIFFNYFFFCPSGGSVINSTAIKSIKDI